MCVYEKYDCYGLECLGDTICLEVELNDLLMLMRTT